MTLHASAALVRDVFACGLALWLATACGAAQAESDRNAAILLPSMEHPEVPCSDAPAPSSRPGTVAADAPDRVEPSAAPAGTDDDDAAAEPASTQEPGHDDGDDESAGGSVDTKARRP